jgi:hypothetical protein
MFLIHLWVINQKSAVLSYLRLKLLLVSWSAHTHTETRTDHDAGYLCPISPLTYLYLHVAGPWMGGRDEFRYELPAPFCVHNMANAVLRYAVHALNKGVLYVRNVFQFHGTHINEFSPTLLRNQWRFVFTVKGNNLLYSTMINNAATTCFRLYDHHQASSYKALQPV